MFLVFFCIRELRIAGVPHLEWFFLERAVVNLVSELVSTYNFTFSASLVLRRAITYLHKGPDSLWLVEFILTDVSWSTDRAFCGMVNLTVQIVTRVALFEIARMREGAVLCLLRNHICWLTAAACTEKAAETEREDKAASRPSMFQRRRSTWQYSICRKTVFSRWLPDASGDEGPETTTWGPSRGIARGKLLSEFYVINSIALVRCKGHLERTSMSNLNRRSSRSRDSKKTDASRIASNLPRLCSSDRP